MNFIRNILLSLIAITISIVFIEIFLSIFYPQAKNSSWRVQNSDGVYLNKNKGFAKHEYKGEREKISVTYKFGKYHNRILVNDNYSSNEKKILVLGDSNVFGWLLDDKDLFLSKVQKKYPSYYFINSAAGGFSDADMYLYLKRYCSKIKPEFVLFFIDVDRVIRKNILKLNKYNELEIQKNEINKLKAILNDKIIYNYLMENSNFFQFIKSSYIMITGSYIDYVDKKNYKNKKNLLEKKGDTSKNINNLKFEKEKNLLKKLFNKIQDEAEQCGSNIIFIDIALYDKINTSKARNYVINNFYNFFKNSKKINFISLYNPMTYFRNFSEINNLEEGHPNAKGNDLIFKYLGSELSYFLK